MSLYKLAQKGDAMAWVILQDGMGVSITKGDLLVGSSTEQCVSLSNNAVYTFNTAVVTNLGSPPVLSTINISGSDYYRMGTSALGFVKQANGQIGDMVNGLNTSNPVIIRTMTSFDYSGGTNIWTDGVVNYTITGWTQVFTLNFSNATFSGSALSEYLASDGHTYYRIGATALGFRKGDTIDQINTPLDYYNSITTTPTLSQSRQSFDKDTGVWTDTLGNAYTFSGYTLSLIHI